MVSRGGLLKGAKIYVCYDCYWDMTKWSLIIQVVTRTGFTVERFTTMQRILERVCLITQEVLWEGGAVGGGGFHDHFL